MILFTSCVQQPIQIGLNTYTQSHYDRSVAYMLANGVCQRKAQALKVIRERTNASGLTILDYKCLNPMSAEYRDAKTYESTDKVTIEK
ncbi:MAG: hypothetical protein U9N49_02375 [Campylobacterota bacterium]|nr:hypothetical protein [Campylobacterota bacterium]